MMTRAGPGLQWATCRRLNLNLLVPSSEPPPPSPPPPQSQWRPHVLPTMGEGTFTPQMDAGTDAQGRCLVGA